MIKQTIRKVFRFREELSISFYVLDFIFRKILRHNARVDWPIHFTSTIWCPEKIIRGKGVWPGDSPHVYINATNGVTVGDYTNIGPGVTIASVNHDFVDNRIQIPAEPVQIGRFCWIGANACILPEVVLGDFTIVGAGAVVTKNFENGYCVIAGNPAKVISNLNVETCTAFADTKI